MKLSRTAAVAGLCSKVALACGLSLALWGSGTSLAAEDGKPALPEKLRLGYFPNITHGPALIGTANGLFQQKLGDSIKLETKVFNAGPSLIEAMFANEIDIGYIGPNPAINGYVKSKGKALRIICGACSGGALFVVRPESGIAKASDLAGKKLATPQLGNTQDVALRSYLLKNKLKTADKGGTTEIVPTDNPAILSMFMQGRIDGAWVPEPWGTRLITEGKGKLFLDERTLWPDGKFVTAHVIVSTGFLNKYSEAVRRFVEAHVAAVDFINSDIDKAKEIMNKEIARITTKAFPKDILDKSMENMLVTYDPVQASLLKSADDAYELGFLGASRPDISGIYSLEILNEVLLKLGRPRIQY